MRKIGNLVSVLLTALLISFIVVPNVAEGVDGIFLMENLNRQYFNFLNPKKAEHLYIPHDFDGKNLIVSTLEPGFYEGFDVMVNDDGSVTVNGVNNEEDVHIRYGRVELDDGQYLLSDGGASEQIEKGSVMFMTEKHLRSFLNALVLQQIRKVIPHMRLE